jgi:hypothetical protein
MNKTYAKFWAVFVVLAAACAGDGDSDVLAVPGEVSALLSGDGMPANEREKAYEHDELWLDIEPTGELYGFTSHPWDLEPRQNSYDLQLEFAPAEGPGRRELVSALVCFATCGDKPDRDGCAGPCFSHLQSGSVDIERVSKDGKSFELTFAFEVADSQGRVIRVREGKARTHD